MRTALFTLSLILGWGFLIGIFVFALMLLAAARKLLEQFHKLASLYPPFPSARADEEEGKEPPTRVIIQEQWDENSPGRD